MYETVGYTNLQMRRTRKPEVVISESCHYYFLCYLNTTISLVKYCHVV